MTITVPSRPEALWPERFDARVDRKAHVLSVLAVAVGAAYLLFRILATLSPMSLSLGLPLLALEAWSLAAFAVNAFALWDVDAVSRPEPVTETEATVAVLIPTIDEPHHVLLPTLMAAARMRLATQVLVLDDGNRAWLAGTCDELGIEYRPRLRHLGGRAGQLNAALDTLTADFLVVLDPDQVAIRDFIGHTLPHFDDGQIALVQTPRDTYNMDSFEHVEVGRRRLSESSMRERLFGAGRNRENAAFWSGGSVVLRRSALQAVGGFVAGHGDEDLITSVHLHQEGWSSAQHNEVLARGVAAADSAEYMARTRVAATAGLAALRHSRFMTARGLTFAQRLTYLQSFGGGLSGWRTLGYLVLAPLALLLGLTPAVGPIAAFVAFLLVAGGIRRLATTALVRGQLARANGDAFVLIRMAATIGTWPALVTGRADRPVPLLESARRVPTILWLTLALNIAGLIWAALALSGIATVNFPYSLIAAGAAVWTALNVTRLTWAIARIRSSVYGGDRRQATRVEVDGHVFLDGERVHVLDLSLTGVRLLTYGDPAEVGSYCSVTFTDPNRRPAVVTGTIVAADRRPHGHELRVGLEDEQTYVLGAILADALIKRD
jgi:cellulose synthase (UDP-forming)